MEGKLKVGFIGLGIMGGPMARHIMNAGFPLAVYTKTKEKMNAYAEKGATATCSPAELASLSDVVISCLPENETVREVLFTGENAAVKGAKPGTIFVETSTIAPAAAVEFHNRATELGFYFLDAPLTGAQIGAETANLTIMVGGEEEIFNKVKPVLEPTAKVILLVGGPGQGQMMKMANQIAGMANMVGTAEALLFCRKAGLDLNQAIQIIGSGASGSQAMNVLGPRIIDRNFKPGFTIELQQKDLRYALEAADQIKTPLPVTALCNQLYRALLANDEGHLAFPAVTLILERLAGLDLDKE